MNTHIDKLKDNCIDAINEMHKIASLSAREEEERITELRNLLKSEFYKSLGLIAMELSQMPWKNCQDVDVLEEKLLVIGCISGMLEDNQ